MKNPLTVIGGIVTLVSLLIITVWVFSVSGPELTSEQRNLAFVTIVGLVANAIPSLLALLKSESTQHDINNGVVKGKVKEAIAEVAAEDAATAVEAIPTLNPMEGSKANG